MTLFVPPTALSPEPSPAPAATMPRNAQEDWRRVQGRLLAEVGGDIYDSWFHRMNFDEIRKGVVHLSVPTPFLKSWISSHYAERVLSCWQKEDPNVSCIEIAVRSAVLRPLVRVPVSSKSKSGESRTLGNGSHQTIQPPPPMQPSNGGSPLDPRMTFQNFIDGPCNSLARAAVKQVADARKSDPVMFNPLYIHSRVGLGKTHLLQALAWAGREGEERKVLYLTAEKFMFGFVSALQRQTPDTLKQILSKIDVLAIDDLHVLQGKFSRAEFYQTINNFIDAGRQVVIAADCPPLDLEILDERVRSRLSGGLVVELHPLSTEVRLDILKNRVATLKHYHPTFDVQERILAYIASVVTQHGRSLEGAINRLVACNKLTGQPVTMEMAEREILDLARPPELKRVKIEDIQRVVARQYNVSRADLLSSRRTANVVRPRQVAMYLGKVLTLRSLPEIGRRFGGRDHTTVLHAVRKMENLVKDDSLFAEEVASLKRQLQD